MWQPSSIPDSPGDAGCGGVHGTRTTIKTKGSRQTEQKELYAWLLCETEMGGEKMDETARIKTICDHSNIHATIIKFETFLAEKNGAVVSNCYALGSLLSRELCDNYR